MKNIELPRRVLVGEGAVDEVADVISKLGLSGKSAVICDENTRGIAGEKIAGQIKSELVDSATPWNAVESLREARFLVAVGGGSVIDAVKIAAKNLAVPFVSVPTAASHDGIASPLASVKGEKAYSVRTSCPLAVIADTKIIAEAPKKLLSAGCADAISNYTAVLDWKLAAKERGEYYGDYAAALSALSAEIIMANADKALSDVSMVVEALISSGVAIGIAGSSRPCSGSEHLFSHTLDLICEKPALHGEQCGVGAILMACLHEAEWELVRDSLKKVNAPTNAKQLGIPDEKILEALTKAHTIRNRYTILRNGLTEQKARELAEKTKVI
ncbi:MAG: NAD(P)-dependent glycerol-1-phosphate dehydrogenase [Candidatus Altiarchaeota archaeon]